MGTHLSLCYMYSMTSYEVAEEEDDDEEQEE